MNVDRRHRPGLADAGDRHARYALQCVANVLPTRSRGLPEQVFHRTLQLLPEHLIEVDRATETRRQARDRSAKVAERFQAGAKTGQGVEALAERGRDRVVGHVDRPERFEPHHQRRVGEHEVAGEVNLGLLGQRDAVDRRADTKRGLRPTTRQQVGHGGREQFGSIQNPVAVGVCDDVQTTRDHHPGGVRIEVEQAEGDRRGEAGIVGDSGREPQFAQPLATDEFQAMDLGRQRSQGEMPAAIDRRHGTLPPGIVKRDR